MRPKHYTISIPTKPYLAKYIAGRYGSPVILNNNTLFGIVVLSLLQKRVETHLNLRDKHIQFRTFTSQITCLAPWRYMYHYGVDLTDDQIIMLNRTWDAQFEEDLYYFCQRSIKADGRYKGYDTAIENFATTHGIIIDVDTTFDCLKKTEYRFRKERENILSSFVPSQNTGNSPTLF